MSEYATRAPLRYRLDKRINRVLTAGNRVCGKYDGIPFINLHKLMVIICGTLQCGAFLSLRACHDEKLFRRRHALQVAVTDNSFPREPHVPQLDCFLGVRSMLRPKNAIFLPYLSAISIASWIREMLLDCVVKINFPLQREISFSSVWPTICSEAVNPGRSPPNNRKADTNYRFPTA